MARSNIAKAYTGEPPGVDSNGSGHPPSLYAHMWDALQLLLQGHDYARQLNRDVWDFSVEIGDLHRAGLTNNDLRWLMCRELIDHAKDVADEEGRVVRVSRSLRFSRSSCFVLTGSGAALARNELQREQILGAVSQETLDAEVADEPLRPCWDCDRREIRVGGELVKQFKLPSPNQEMVLMVFEEEGWPPRIDDPLPSHPDQSPKRRLQDTIRSLNRNQKARRIRFKGDGTGEGILWELVSPKPAPRMEAID